MKKYIDKLKQESSFLKKGVSIKDVIPAVSTHPGEILVNELRSRSIRQNKFAEICGVQPSQLNEIIKGKRGINADIALALEKHLKINAEFWLQVQMHYELNNARINLKLISSMKTDILKVKHVLKPSPKKTANKLVKV